MASAVISRTRDSGSLCTGPHLVKSGSGRWACRPGNSPVADGRAAAGDALHGRAHEGAHVVLADAAGRAGALHLVDVHAQIAGQAPHRGRGRRHGIARAHGGQVDRHVGEAVGPGGLDGRGQGLRRGHGGRGGAGAGRGGW